MGADSADELRVRIPIGSHLEEVEKAASRTEEILRESEVDPKSVDAVGLAVREAVGNAIQHGTRMLPDRAAQMDLRLGERWVEIEIRDSGEGFDPDRLPDPRAPENLLKSCGRGIFLMRQVMDEVVFEFPSDGGTAVKMRKKIERRP